MSHSLDQLSNFYTEELNAKFDLLHQALVGIFLQETTSSDTSSTGISRSATRQLLVETAKMLLNNGQETVFSNLLTLKLGNAYPAEITNDQCESLFNPAISRVVIDLRDQYRSDFGSFNVTNVKRGVEKELFQLAENANYIFKTGKFSSDEAVNEERIANVRETIDGLNKTPDDFYEYRREYIGQLGRDAAIIANSTGSIIEFVLANKPLIDSDYQGIRTLLSGKDVRPPTNNMDDPSYDQWLVEQFANKTRIMTIIEDVNKARENLH